MGIGSYESFQYVKELGGAIAVESEVGQGTAIKITLPLLEITTVPVVVSYHGADAQVELENPSTLAATRRVFELAGTDYGRVDYGMYNDKVQVWEINTTPQIVNNPARDKPERQAVHAKFAESFCAALNALDPPPTGAHDARA